MLHDEPDLVRKMVDMVVEVHVALARRAVRAGADIVSLGDDYAWKEGPMVSLPMFREFFLPGIKRVVRAAQEEGAIVLKHCDGNIWSLMDAFVETGINGINPLEPIATMDLSEVKRRYGDVVCLLGNVDCGYILSDAPPGGGYILTSSNSLHSSVRPGNYIAMVEAGRAYGKYPLDMAALRD